MLINIIIPLVYIYAQKMDYPDLQVYAYDLFMDFPSLADNSINSTMRKYLTEDIEDKISKKAIMQQGLIQIYHNYCENHLCEFCTNKLDDIKARIVL